MQCVFKDGNPELRIGKGCTAATSDEAFNCCAKTGSEIEPMEVLLAYEATKTNQPLFGSITTGLLSAIHTLEKKLGIQILD